MKSVSYLAENKEAPKDVFEELLKAWVISVALRHEITHKEIQSYRKRFYEALEKA